MNQEEMTNRDFDNAIHFEDKMPSDAASFIGAFRAVELAAWHARNTTATFQSSLTCLLFTELSNCFAPDWSSRLSKNGAE